MSEDTVDGLARLRRERPGLFTAGVVVLVFCLVAVVLTDPVPAIVSALPLPDLPAFPDLPDLPGWARWLRLGIVTAFVVLAVIGALEQERKRDRSDSEEED